MEHRGAEHISMLKCQSTDRGSRLWTGKTFVRWYCAAGVLDEGNCTGIPDADSSFRGRLFRLRFECFNIAFLSAGDISNSGRLKDEIQCFEDFLPFSCGLDRRY